MKTQIISLTICAALVLCSCGGNQKKEQVTVQDSIPANIADDTYSMSEKHVSDSVLVGNTLYGYEYSFTKSDTLPKVRNSEGYYYYDNQLELTVTKGGERVFHRTFSKYDFKNIVPEEILNKSILVGFSINYMNKSDASSLHFYVTVGNPDETADEDFIMTMNVSTNGSIKIDKATDIDTEPINPGMNIDPSDDDGV